MMHASITCSSVTECTVTGKPHHSLGRGWIEIRFGRLELTVHGDVGELESVASAIFFAAQEIRQAHGLLAGTADEEPARQATNGEVVDNG